VSPTRRLRLSIPTTRLIRSVFLDEQHHQTVLEDPMDDLQLRIWVESVLPHHGRNGDRPMDSEASQLCSRRNPIVPTSSSAKRSISASVVVKPRLARAVPERP